MEKLTIILSSIDWLFAAVILIGGRYWGSKYFIIFKRNPAWNFLAFATAFGIVWLIIKQCTAGIGKNEIGNLFLTFLFTTSFYEIIAQRVFEWIESLPIFKK